MLYYQPNLKHVLIENKMFIRRTVVSVRDLNYLTQLSPERVKLKRDLEGEMKEHFKEKYLLFSKKSLHLSLMCNPRMCRIFNDYRG